MLAIVNRCSYAIGLYRAATFLIFLGTCQIKARLAVRQQLVILSQAVKLRSGCVIVRCSYIALVLLAGGCSLLGWHRIDFPSQPERGRQFQIWSRGTVARWHGVVISWDSLSGIPYNKPLDCDSCRQSIARTEVDSIRAAKASTAHTVVAAALLAALAFFAFIAVHYD
jgi:hypothetical protein